MRKDLLDELINGLKQHKSSSSSSSNMINDNNRNFLTSPHTQIYDYLESITIADMLDFLSKELLRLQSEQMIHLFVLLADRYRYQREVTETANRIKSMEKQKFEDHILQQV